VRVSVLDQTKRCRLLDHGTVTRCNYCKASIAKLQSTSTVQVAFTWYFVEKVFSKRCAFWSARECRHIFPQRQYICEWTICAVKMVRESVTKRLLCGVTVAKISFICVNFLFEQINQIRTAAHGHPQWRHRHSGSARVFDYDLYCRTWACLLCTFVPPLTSLIKVVNSDSFNRALSVFIHFRFMSGLVFIVQVTWITKYHSY